MKKVKKNITKREIVKVKDKEYTRSVGTLTIGKKKYKISEWKLNKGSK